MKWLEAAQKNKKKMLAEKMNRDADKPRKRLTNPQAAWKKEKALQKKAKEAKTRISFIKFCDDQGIPQPIPEYLFAKSIGRKWRIDYYFERKCIVNGVEKVIKIALEVEGGIHTRGRHVRPEGFIADMEKYNTLVDFGIALYRVQPKELFNYDTAMKLRKLLHPDQYPNFKV